MALKIEWRPVLQALPLKDYHPEYGDNVIMVCVNPQPEFLQERTALMTEYAKRLVEAQASTQKDPQQAEATTLAFGEWTETTFQPGMQNWFARLWSFGDEKFTVEDLNEYDQVDPHFLGWLKRRSIEMIDDHRAGRKKA